MPVCDAVHVSVFVLWVYIYVCVGDAGGCAMRVLVIPEGV